MYIFLVLSLPRSLSRLTVNFKFSQPVALPPYLISFIGPSYGIERGWGRDKEERGRRERRTEEAKEYRREGRGKRKGVERIDTI